MLGRARSDATAVEKVAPTQKARRLGIFGAPSFVAAGEIFWSDDRLEDAVERALRHG